MQLALYGNDSAPRSKQYVPVIHMAVVSCCVGVTYPNRCSGIWETGVCNNWRCVYEVVIPLIGHLLFRRLWLYQTSEVYGGSNEMWTTGRICDHRCCIHCICMIGAQENKLLTKIGWTTLHTHACIDVHSLDITTIYSPSPSVWQYLDK